MAGVLSLPAPDKAPAAPAAEGYGAPQKAACTLERTNEPTGILLHYITL